MGKNKCCIENQSSNAQNPHENLGVATPEFYGGVESRDKWITWGVCQSSSCLKHLRSSCLVLKIPYYRHAHKQSHLDKPSIGIHFSDDSKLYQIGKASQNSLFIILTNGHTKSVSIYINSSAWKAYTIQCQKTHVSLLRVPTHFKNSKGWRDW